jgi:hypothetical protein
MSSVAHNRLSKMKTSFLSIFCLNLFFLISTISNGQIFEFSTAGAQGSLGPDQDQVDQAYSATNLEGKIFVTPTGIQMWEVPEHGYYRITARGAKGGGNDSYSGGAGAEMIGTFELFKGEMIQILVGQSGQDNEGSHDNDGGGGGGGSFVVRSPYNSQESILVIAGGGGGAGTPSDGLPGLVTSVGGDLSGMSGEGGINGGGGGAALDGTTGNGLIPGEHGWSCSFGSGGGGFFSRGGMNCNGGSPFIAGRAYINGGEGGPAHIERSGVTGGFGGGAGVGHRAGGGGGYSGGAGPALGGAGGGGSLNNGFNQANTPGVNFDNGIVIIELLYGIYNENNEDFFSGDNTAENMIVRTDEGSSTQSFSYDAISFLRSHNKTLSTYNLSTTTFQHESSHSDSQAKVEGTVLHIFPNPGNGQCSVKISTTETIPEQGFITVCDTRGNVVYQKQIQTTGRERVIPLNLLQLADGTYLINMKLGALSLNERMVIQR